MLDFIEVIFWDLIQKYSQSSHLCSELIVRVFFGPKQSLLIQFNLPLFMRQDKEGHIVWARPALLLKRHHGFNWVSLLEFLLVFELKLLALLLLDVDGIGVGVLVAAKILKWYTVCVHSRLHCTGVQTLALQVLLLSWARRFGHE